MNPEGADLLQTGLRERDEAENEPLLDSFVESSHNVSLLVFVCSLWVINCE